MRRSLLHVSMLMILVGCGSETPPPGLVKSYPTFGCCHYAAVIDLSKLPSSRNLPSIGKYVCSSVETNACFVMFYTSDREAPHGGVTFKNILDFGTPDFVYGRNYKSNIEDYSWNCDTFAADEFSKNECLL